MNKTQSCFGIQLTGNFDSAKGFSRVHSGGTWFGSVNMMIDIDLQLPLIDFSRPLLKYMNALATKNGSQSQQVISTHILHYRLTLYWSMESPLFLHIKILQYWCILPLLVPAVHFYLLISSQRQAQNITAVKTYWFYMFGQHCFIIYLFIYLFIYSFIYLFIMLICSFIYIL